MPRVLSRQVAAAGLALFVLIMMVRAAWTEARSVMVRAELDQAARWLRGAVIVLDPGHGGDDPGAVVGKTLEKTLTLQIAFQLKQVLEAQGARVILTRSRDEDLGGPIREELARRVALVDRHKAHIFVSVHANKDHCRCWGAQTFYQKDGMPAGQQMALLIQRRLREMTPTTRSALPADYFVLRTSPVPSAMVEVGFLTHEPERRRLMEPDYQQTLARAIALGLADFFRSQVPEAESQGHIGR